MIQGIPYFKDKDTNELYQEIRSLKETDFEYTCISLYELVKLGLTYQIVIRIKDKWLTWVKDILFNYRDKRVILPYYTYEVSPIPLQVSVKNIEHIEVVNDTQCCRYNYALDYIDLNIGDTLYTYNVDMNIAIAYKVTHWTDEKELNTNKLYKLYIDSCYHATDAEHYDSGYHYIIKSGKGFQNSELKLRRKLMLDDFSIETKRIEDYRDVREYKYEEVVLKHGFLDSFDSYKIRRLKFESYLYCCLRQGLHNELIDKLTKPSDYVKIGEDIKLIVKGYWLNNIDKTKNNIWTEAKK